MSGNAKFSLLALVIFLSGCAGNGVIPDFIDKREELVQKNPSDADAHRNLGIAYLDGGWFEKSIASFKEAIRIKPEFSQYYLLGNAYQELGKYGRDNLEVGRGQNAIASYREAIRIKPDYAEPHYGLGVTYEMLDLKKEALISYKEALRINPDYNQARNSLIDLERIIALTMPAPPVRQSPQPSQEQTPQSGSGSGFFVSKMGHVITNAHVVQNCNKITIGDNANKQVPAELINTDSSNDLALLKLSSLEMASAESKSLIQKLSIVVVPLASKGLLRSDDVRLGEKVMVAGYPFGDTFSNTIKVTTGVVSATRGAGDNSGQFQLDAAVQPGNSGGPIYDSGGNIVGVVVAQINKKTFGSFVENMNFGIKASTVRQFLMSSGLSSKKSERTEEKSTQQLAEIAKNQALMVMCLQ